MQPIFHYFSESLQKISWHHTKVNTLICPQQIWTNGMTDQRRRGILHIAEINDIPVGSEDLEWFGIDWNAPHPADDDLATVNVDDVSSPLNQEQETILRRINPMTLSATFGIDLFLNAMNTIFS